MPRGREGTPEEKRLGVRSLCRTAGGLHQVSACKSVSGGEHVEEKLGTIVWESLVNWVVAKAKQGGGLAWGKQVEKRAKTEPREHLISGRN